MRCGGASGTRLSVPAGKSEKTPGLSTATVGRVLKVVALSPELFDAIEVNAARTGNHKRAAVRMSRLAAQGTPTGMGRAEAHMRAGDQWLLADDPEAAVEEFRIAIADAGPTFDDPRVPLARAMFALGRRAEADSLLRELKESEGRSLAPPCDLVAESRFGLTGGLFSRNPKTVEAVVRRTPVGNLYVNRAITGAMVGRQPFGGSRLSGTGSKAGGPDYLRHFVEPRVVCENTTRHGLVV